MFVLHGNVFDAVVHQQRTLTITELPDRRPAEGLAPDGGRLQPGDRRAVRAPRGRRPVVRGRAARHREAEGAGGARARRWSAASKVAVILEYAEAIAPAGDPAFQADSDRAAIITLQRWSFLPEIDRADNLVLLVAENLSELSPKLVSNPKVGVVEVPMPDLDAQARGDSPGRPEADRQGRRPLRGGHGGPEGDPDRLDPGAASGLRGRRARSRGVHRGHPGRERGCRGPRAQARRAHRRPVARRDQEAAGARRARPDDRRRQRGRAGPRARPTG